MNSDLSDIADGLSSCLTTDGQSFMTGQTKAAAGTVTSPGITFANDLDTGAYRIGTNEIGVACAGAKVLDISTTGLDVIGTVKQNGSAILPIGLGPVPWSGLTAPTLWLLCYGQTLLRASYPDLWTFASAEIAGGNTLYTNGNGTTTFTIPDMRGRGAAGKDNMGGSAASRLTSTTISPDANTLGGSGGAQTVTLAQSNLTNTGLDISTASASSIPTVSGTASNAFPSSVATVSSAGSGNPPSTQSGGVAALVVTTTLSGNTASMNGGVAQTAVNKVQPTLITNFIIFAGA